jgi:hypothetical protein
MHLLLSSLLLVLVAGLYYLWKLVRNEQGSGAGRARLVFLVQDQEPWLEGFFRKLFRKLQNAARLEVQVVDSGSRDGTAAVLELLSRILNPGSFIFTFVRPPGFPAAPWQAEGLRDRPASAGFARSVMGSALSLPAPALIIQIAFSSCRQW